MFKKATQPETLNVPALLRLLKPQLKRVLQRRGLWFLPPAYLGYATYTTWWKESDALSDLANDACIHLIENWLPLKTAAASNRADWLTAHMLPQFISLRQREADPRGFAAFKNTVNALRLVVAAGAFTAEPAEKVTHTSVLRAQGVRPSQARLLASRIRECVVNDPEWNQLAERLITPSLPAQRELARFIASLAHSLTCFRVRDLVGVVRDEVRARFVGEILEPASTDLPSIDEFDDLQVVCKCVADRIGLGRNSRAQRMRLLAAEICRHMRAFSEFPKQAEIARALQLPRQRVSEVWEEIRKFFSECVVEHGQQRLVRP